MTIFDKLKKGAEAVSKGFSGGIKTVEKEIVKDVPEVIKTDPSKIFEMPKGKVMDAIKGGIVGGIQSFVPPMISAPLQTFMPSSKTQGGISKEQYSKDIQNITESFHNVNKNQQSLFDATKLLSENQQKIVSTEQRLGQDISKLAAGEITLKKDISTLATGETRLSTEVKELYNIDTRIVNTQNNILSDIDALKQHDINNQNQQDMLNKKVEQEVIEEQVEINEIKEQMENIQEKVLESFYKELDLKEMVTLLNMLDNKNEIMNFLARHRKDFDKLNQNDKNIVIQVAKTKLL